MTEAQRKACESQEALREIVESLKGRKFRLDRGHRITCGCFLGNSITIHNGKHPEIICSQCGH